MYANILFHNNYHLINEHSSRRRTSGPLLDKTRRLLGQLSNLVLLVLAVWADLASATQEMQTYARNWNDERIVTHHGTMVACLGLDWNES